MTMSLRGPSHSNGSQFKVISISFFFQEDAVFIILFVCHAVPPSVHPYGPLSLRPSQPGLKPEAGLLAGPQIWLAGPQAWLAGPQAWLAGPQAWLAGPQAWLAGPQAWLDGPQAWPDGPEGGTYGRTNGKSPHSTGLRPLPGPLPCFPPREPRHVEQGKGTVDHLMSLGDWLKP